MAFAIVDPAHTLATEDQVRALLDFFFDREDLLGGIVTAIGNRKSVASAAYDEPTDSALFEAVQELADHGVRVES